MTYPPYPPSWRRVDDHGALISLVRAHPFANLVTAHSGLRSTRIPFVVDVEEGRPVRLRAHLNAQNPQAPDLDGQEALVTFAGRSSYVSPNWRTNIDRAGTVDYEEVQIEGVVRIREDFDFFVKLINDLAALFEPQYPDVSDYPDWNTTMAPPGYMERLFPGIRAFELNIKSARMISKLHQSFSEEDRVSIANHLDRSDKEDAREIAKKIRATLS
ncbi:MAG: FMN-binding negative transcriptional regulator [Pseudomonadota bacterium]